MPKGTYDNDWLLEVLAHTTIFIDGDPSSKHITLSMPTTETILSTTRDAPVSPTLKKPYPSS